MSEREQAKSIIDRLPEYKIGNLLSFLQGMLFDDEMEDDLYCERLAEAYLNDTSPPSWKADAILEMPSDPN